MRAPVAVHAVAVLLVALMAPLASGTPGFAYETTIEGYYLSSGRGLTVDDDGNAYVFARYIGDHNENNFVVAKLDPAGGVLWTTDVEGYDHDVAQDLVLDGAGRLLLTGWTDSDDFPTTPDAMDNTLTGFRDVFLMKLSTEDGSILYSTLLGGDYTDEGHGLAVNDAGEIYIVGTTGSTDFPTVNAYQSEPSAPLYIYTDAFITKLSPNAKAILYSTYFGGLQDDTGVRIGLDAAGNMIIAGGTTADDFPLVDPVSLAPNDMYVAKLSADGSTLLFSTYFGGEDDDWFSSMVVDADGHAYLTGTTRSINLPTTIGAFQYDLVGEINGCQTYFPVTFFNCDDTFVTKMATDGTGLIYSTYIGGTHIEGARDIAVDSAGRAHVVGFTTSDDFPGGGTSSASVFMSRLSADGTSLDHTVFKASGSANAGGAVAVGAEGNAYMAGAVNVPADIYVAKVGGDALSGLDDGAVAGGLKLHQNSPNPFNPSTSIAFELPAAGRVSMTVHDAAGRLVRTLVDDELRPAGPQAVRWEGLTEAGEPAASGVYFYRIEVAGSTLSQQMVLLK
jgi:hypothetical protein